MNDFKKVNHQVVTRKIWVFEDGSTSKVKQIKEKGMRKRVYDGDKLQAIVSEYPIEISKHAKVSIEIEDAIRDGEKVEGLGYQLLRHIKRGIASE